MFSKCLNGKCQIKDIFMNKKSSPAGFTLVELLVVISIIALLMGILVSTLSRARALAQCVVCMANLRTLITAWSAYSVNNQERLVGGMPGVRGTTTTLDPRLSWSWYAWVEIPKNELGTYTGGYPTPVMSFTDASMEDELRGIKSGLLYKYTGDIKPYNCASDPRNGSKEAWRSYTIAAGMNIDSPKTNSDSWVDQATNMSQITTPSQKYVFVENLDPRGWNWGYWDIYAPSGTGAVWWNVVAGWHKTKSNWAFADGHAETRKWRDKRTIDICTELNYAKQTKMRAACSVNNKDLRWIVDRRMNKW